MSINLFMMEEPNGHTMELKRPDKNNINKRKESLNGTHTNTVRNSLPQYITELNSLIRFPKGLTT